MKKQTWKKVKWYGNNEEPYASWECWQYGRYVLHPGLWPTEGWSYVLTGNRDDSHSGFLKGVTDLKEAMARIEAMCLKGNS